MSPPLIAVSRLADGISLYSILSGPSPSLAATSCAISMSNPQRRPLASLYPRLGWSALTPMTTLPADLIRSNVGLPVSATLLAGVSAVPDDTHVSPVPELALPFGAAVGVPDLPQAATPNPSVT